MLFRSKESLEHFPSTLPSRRHSAFSAWVSISVGCNNTCTFCIVPQLRGPEKDREEIDIVREAQALVDEGVIEITLLGQNVNAYKNGGFANLLRKVGEIKGLERIRFMSPHPKDFTDDVIEAMAESPNVMPHLHMPLQSGSDRILQSMRRSYRIDRYRSIIEKVRKTIPHSTITTDLIVGFPGESEADFQETMAVCEEMRFLAAYTFQYSKRPGTPAAEMADQVPAAVISERYTRLHEHLNGISQSVNNEVIGSEVEVLVSEMDGSHGKGRSRDFRLVHFEAGAEQPRPGDLVNVRIASAKPHFIFSDGAPLLVTRTRGEIGRAHV